VEEGLWSLEEDKPEYVGDYRGAAYSYRRIGCVTAFSKGRRNVPFNKGHSEGCNTWLIKREMDLFQEDI